MPCPTTVHNTVCVDAEVTITPSVTVGDIRTYCKGDPEIGACPGIPSSSCTFSVRQEICVQIPLSFAADATAMPIGIVCGTPGVGACTTDLSCTHTIGYFKNHPELIAELLITAGGTINLGNSITGLGYVVSTVAEAVDVLNFNIPSIALPTTPVFATQYSVLYAQLLAAKLNVLNGAVCDAASAAIIAADAFLATSPVAGVNGAAVLQEDLASFNEGNSLGCPGECN